MKKLTKKTKAIIAGACILAVVGVSGIIAYFTDTATVTNKATMGIVDIDLKEYMIDDQGNKVAWEDKTNIVPGDVISKIPEISCVKGAVDCYIRAKVDIKCEDASLQSNSQMLTLDNLNVDEEKWFYCEADGYFYYKTILKDSSAPVVLFSEVTIPDTLDNTWSLEQFSIDVTAEAIQSKNFTPSFATGTTEPWPGITSDDIQECIYPDHTK